jgi:hypothetical protein
MKVQQYRLLLLLMKIRQEADASPDHLIRSGKRACTGFDGGFEVEAAIRGPDRVINRNFKFN